MIREERNLFQQSLMDNSATLFCFRNDFLMNDHLFARNLNN